MPPSIEAPRLYQGHAPVIEEMNEQLRKSEGEHIIAGAHYYLTIAKLRANIGLIDADTEEERWRSERVRSSTWVELGVAEGVKYDLGSAGWGGVYSEFNKKYLEGTLKMLFGEERIFLDGDVEDYRSGQRFFVLGDVACSAFAPKLAELDTTTFRGDATPDYKRHLHIQHNRGLLALSQMRKIGLTPEVALSREDIQLQEITEARLSRLKELVVRGGIAPVVGRALGWDSPSWLSPKLIAERVGAFEFDAELTYQEVLDTLMAQVEIDEDMKKAAESQSMLAQTAGGSSDRYVSNLVSNVVTNLFGIH